MVTSFTEEISWGGTLQENLLFSHKNELGKFELGKFELVKFELGNFELGKFELGKFN